MSLETLKKRASFLYVRDGRKWITPSLVLQARKRRDRDKPDESQDARISAEYPPRFGFTASKKVGNAVQRNRAKRRMREAVRHLALDKENTLSRHNYDYVLIARQGTLKLRFDEILNDLRFAFKRVHGKSKRSAKK